MQDGDIYFKCYAVEDGTYCYYDANEEIYYYATAQMDKLLYITYNFAKELIYYKEYNEALKVFDMLLFTAYTCNEVAAPVYDDFDSIYNVFNVHLSDVRDELPFNLDDVCLHAIYATLLSKNIDKCEYIYKYLELCRVYKLPESFDLGIESVKNIDLFYKKFITYLQNKNNQPMLNYILELYKQKDEN